MEAIAKRFYVGADVDTSALTLATLTEGAVVVLDKNMNILTTGDGVDTTDTIYIAVGGATGIGPAISPAISAQDILQLDYSGLAYVAGTKKYWYVGYNTSSGSIVETNSQEYLLRIVSRKPDSHADEVDRYQYIADSAASEQDIAEAFVAAINARTNQKFACTATAVNTGATYGFKIEADNLNEDFSVGFELGWGETTLTEGAMVYSVGRLAQVIAEEADNLGYRGVTNNVCHPLKPTTIATAAGFHQYVINFRKRHGNGLTPGLAMVSIKIAIPSTASSFSFIDFEEKLYGWFKTLNMGTQPVSLT